ncbi:hypothetical protein CONPUDRAFT_152406 [Coniophora puteana RWD-64-598 SS2]|uniref:Uncharacterized protein n=1 Tax=Coniophora puteana (strain RWD-64-598) TaxID=741705 RepID=A0A5M3MXB5_CONPW|nr:uncharacterized protein CONPUDRAFT_152406 [Coniophora puteana RWD-64-598 SS2]EIW83375.1 hypothetical protein CONPUDRAFT_152406 [Coniophora puteana RWD-64-598 SS2]
MPAVRNDASAHPAPSASAASAPTRSSTRTRTVKPPPIPRTLTGTKATRSKKAASTSKSVSSKKGNVQAEVTQTAGPPPATVNRTDHGPSQSNEEKTLTTSKTKTTGTTSIDDLPREENPCHPNAAPSPSCRDGAEEEGDEDAEGEDEDAESNKDAEDWGNKDAEGDADEDVVQPAVPDQEPSLEEPSLAIAAATRAGVDEEDAEEAERMLDAGDPLDVESISVPPHGAHRTDGGEASNHRPDVYGGDEHGGSEEDQGAEEDKSAGGSQLGAKSGGQVDGDSVDDSDYSATEKQKRIDKAQKNDREGRPPSPNSEELDDDEWEEAEDIAASRRLSNGKIKAQTKGTNNSSRGGSASSALPSARNMSASANHANGPLHVYPVPSQSLPTDNPSCGDSAPSPLPSTEVPVETPAATNRASRPSGANTAPSQSLPTLEDIFVGMPPPEVGSCQERIMSCRFVDWPVKPGRLSAEEEKHLVELDHTIMKAVWTSAFRIKKRPDYVWKHLGVELKPYRQVSMWNKFQKWWWGTQNSAVEEEPTGVEDIDDPALPVPNAEMVDAYTLRGSEDYLRRCAISSGKSAEDLAKLSKAEIQRCINERHPIWDEIHIYYNDEVSPANMDAVDRVSQMNRARDAFSAAARMWKVITGIHVMGLLFYTGPDAAPRNYSCAWSGDDLLNELATEHNADIESILHHVQTLVSHRELNMQRKVPKPLLESRRLELTRALQKRGKGDGLLQRLARNWTRMWLTLLADAGVSDEAAVRRKTKARGVYEVESSDKDIHIQWADLPNLLFKHRLVVYNWALTDILPGDFSPGLLNLQEMRLAVCPWMRSIMRDAYDVPEPGGEEDDMVNVDSESMSIDEADKKTLKLVPMDDEDKALIDEHKEEAFDIVLVRNTEGEPVRFITSSSKFMTEMKVMGPDNLYEYACDTLKEEEQEMAKTRERLVEREKERQRASKKKRESNKARQLTREMKRQLKKTGITNSSTLSPEPEAHSDVPKNEVDEPQMRLPRSKDIPRASAQQRTALSVERSAAVTPPPPSQNRGALGKPAGRAGRIDPVVTDGWGGKSAPLASRKRLSPHAEVLEVDEDSLPSHAEVDKGRSRSRSLTLSSSRARGEAAGGDHRVGGEGHSRACRSRSPSIREISRDGGTQRAKDRGRSRTRRSLSSSPSRRGRDGENAAGGRDKFHRSPSRASARGRDKRRRSLLRSSSSPDYRGYSKHHDRYDYYMPSIRLAALNVSTITLAMNDRHLSILECFITLNRMYNIINRQIVVAVRVRVHGMSYSCSIWSYVSTSSSDANEIARPHKKHRAQD